MVKLFNTYVRSSLEYACQVWNPHLLCNIDLIESAQRKFTKRLPGLYNLTYPERLERLGIKSLELRRLHQDLILTYKILHGMVRVNRNKFFTMKAVRTRGNQLSIYKRKFRLDTTKFFFSNRVVNVWNFLPNHIVKAPNLREFKSQITNINLTRFLKGRGLVV